MWCSIILLYTIWPLGLYERSPACVRECRCTVMYIHKLDNSTINVSMYRIMEVETARICHILYLHT